LLSKKSFEYIAKYIYVVAAIKFRSFSFDLDIIVATVLYIKCLTIVSFSIGHGILAH